MNDLTPLTDTELNEALSSCRRANEPLGQPFGQRLTDCEKCAASGRKCDFDAERGRCSVMS